MRASIVIDDEIISEAMDVSNIKNKNEVIDLALREFVQNHKQKDLREIRGQIQFLEGYDYKVLREGR